MSKSYFSLHILLIQLVEIGWGIGERWAMFLLAWNRLADSSTLQEKRVKINETLDAKAYKKPLPGMKRFSLRYEVIFCAWARDDCGRGVSVWEPGVEVDFHCLDQRQTVAVEELYSQNQEGVPA